MPQHGYIDLFVTMPTSLKTAFIVSFLICACSQHVMAGNWDWASDIALRGNWSDNPALRDDTFDPVSTFSLVAVYNGEFARLTPNSTWAFRPKITSNYYPDQQFKDLQSTDFFLPGSYSLRRPTTAWSLGYNLSRQSILSDDSSLADSGAGLNVDDTVYRASLSPGIGWTLSPKDLLSIGLSAAATDYALEFTRRADSITGSLNMSYLRSLTRRQSLGLTASASKSESENQTFICIPLDPLGPCIIRLIENINDSSSNSLSLDYGYNISDTSKLKLSFGLQNTKTDNSVTDIETGLPIDTGFGSVTFKSTTYNVLYQKTIKRGDFDIRLTRGITPASNGQPQDKYQIQITGQAKLAEKLSGNAVLIASDQQNIILSSTDGTLNKKNRFFSAKLGLAWSISRKWSIGGSYLFRYRKNDARLNTEETLTATGNQVNAGIVYKWKNRR